VTALDGIKLSFILAWMPPFVQEKADEKRRFQGTSQPLLRYTERQKQRASEESHAASVHLLPA
jgi:hypothetical protein